MLLYSLIFFVYNVVRDFVSLYMVNCNQGRSVVIDKDGQQLQSRVALHVLRPKSQYVR